MKRNILFYVMALTCGVVASFIIYSCSTDDFYSDEAIMDETGMVNTRALSSRMQDRATTLLDSVAASDEFWEFQMSSQLLAEKFQEYTSRLSEEDYDQLLERLNNDDYMENFAQEANLENELQQVAIAKENLISHTGFSRLSEDEQLQLFIQYGESSGQVRINLLKSREEGSGADNCLKQKEAEIREAKGEYDISVVECGYDSMTSPCFIQAASRYNMCRRIAERKYQECLKNNA